jgi:hypothetical protein
MNPISDLAQAMQLAVENNHAQWEEEIIDRVILAAESSQSKRELLGLNRKHRKAAELPLFMEKKLF